MLKGKMLEPVIPGSEPFRRHNRFRIAAGLQRLQLQQLQVRLPSILLSGLPQLLLPHLQYVL